MVLLLLALKRGLEKKNSKEIWHRWQKSGEKKRKKTWPQEKVSSNMDANMPIKKASGHLAGLKKSLVMDHQAGKCSTVLKTELATKSFFLQVFVWVGECNIKGTFGGDVCGEARQSTSSCSSSLGLIAAPLPTSFPHYPPLIPG